MLTGRRAAEPPDQPGRPGQVSPRAAEAFREVFGAAPARGAETAPDDVPDWNSLNHVRLVHALEQAFGAVVPAHLLAGPVTLGALVAALEPPGR